MRGRLWGFDVGKYGRHLKEATADFFSLLLHTKPREPPFGTYETVKHEKGKVQSTLKLSEKARAAARLRKRQYEGEVCGTRIEAETSAARDRAKKLEPSNTARKQKKGCAEHSARRKARRYGTPAMTGALSRR
eukprot:s6761_g1.t1